MPSDYQKWLARDVKREEPKELTKEEKRANWWDYHWKHVAICALIVVFVGWLVVDLIQNKNNQPDCQIVYIGTTILPTDTVEALKEQFAPLIGDVDGNGKVIVQILQYTVSADSEDYASDDPSQQTAMVTQLSANDSFLFLLEDPAAFQQRFGLLCQPNGSYPAEGAEGSEPLWYAWAQCPMLAQMNLGDYEINLGGDAPLTGSNQELLSKLYIGRAASHNWSEEQAKAYTEIWKNLTDGVSE